MEAAFQEIATSNPTLAFLALIGANLVAGVMVALKDGKFTWGELADIFKKLFPLFGSYLALRATGQAIAGPMGEAVETASYITALPFVTSILKDVKKLMPKTPASGLLPAIDELNAIYRKHGSGELDAASAGEAVQEWKRQHPEWAGIVPPGWPGTPA